MVFTDKGQKTQLAILGPFERQRAGEVNGKPLNSQSWREHKRRFGKGGLNAKQSSPNYHIRGAKF